MRSQKIPLGKICYQTRDDVQLRTYVLMTRDRKSWNSFVQGANEYGIQPRKYEDFLDLYQDVRVNGIKEPIRVQKIGDKYYIENGAHRVSIARALGHPTIEAFVVSQRDMPSVFLASLRSTVIPSDPSDPRTLKIFKYLSQEVIEKITSLTVHTDVTPIPMKGTAILWPTSRHLWDQIIEDIKKFHVIDETSVLQTTSEEEMKSLTVELYKSDDVADWKVEAKFPHFMSTNPIEYLAVYFTIDDTRHRIKNKTGNEISMAIEDLKSYVRNKYRDEIARVHRTIDGQPDLIIHAGDNEYQTTEIRKTVEKFKEKSK